MKIHGFVTIVFASAFLSSSGQCLKEFLDSINPKVLSMHDGRYHVTFNFSSKLLPNTIFYEGTAYFSKDSATPDNVGDFIMYEKDTIPVFGYIGQYFYKFDAAKKQYTRQYVRRENFFQKTTFDFQHYLAVPYLLNDLHYPFDEYLTAPDDSSFCSKYEAGYMKKDILSSLQSGEQERKSYHYMYRSADGKTMQIRSTDVFAGDVKSKLWMIDSMAAIKNGEKYIHKKINLYTSNFAQKPAQDLDDKNWTPPPPPPQPGEKLLLDTVPVNTVLKTLEYKPYSLDNAGGKLLLLDFWFANCHPCIEAMPKLEALSKKYNDKGLVVIGINPFDYDMDIVKGLLSKNGVDYSVILDSEGELVKAVGVVIYPTMLLVDPKSKKILRSYIGTNEVNSLESDINTLLNAK